jgi:hypothetical protein
VRLLTVLAAWAAAAFATLYVARHTAVGPVLFVVGPAKGIHLADIVVGIVSAACAATITFAVLTAPRPRRRELHDQHR